MLEVFGLFSSKILSTTVRTPTFLCRSSQYDPFKIHSRFYKVFDHLVRRCRGCYFDRREGRLYVECTLHKRHKQAQKTRPPKTPWQFKRKIWKHVTWF